MYKGINYKYFLLSLMAHLALMFGIVVLPSPDRMVGARYLDRGERIQVRLYEKPDESSLLMAEKEEPAVEEEKEVFLPEKKVLDFSDIPPGKEPEKALVYGKVSREASIDFYQKKADKAQHSETVAALPPLRLKRLLRREPAPAVDGRMARELSQPAKQFTHENREGRQTKPRTEGAGQEVFKEKNVYARLEPSPGERGPWKVREPRILERKVMEKDAGQAEEAFGPRPRKPEASASRQLGMPMDVWEMIGPSVDRLEQVPDVPSIRLGEHASIKNSTEDTSNESDAKVISLDTQELKYVSYFWHIKQKIGNLWSYPYEAALSGMEGTAVIRMSLLRTGELEEVLLVRSSGFSILDAEARDAVISAGPFHPFPEQIKDQKLIIEGYFRYLRGFWSVGRY